MTAPGVRLNAIYSLPMRRSRRERFVMNSSSPINPHTGKDWAAAVVQALAAAGMPRNSKLAGGEITGWTTALGSTGFSLRLTDTGQIDWHIVISGKPLLEYRQYQETYNVLTDYPLGLERN